MPLNSTTFDVPAAPAPCPSIATDYDLAEIVRLVDGLTVKRADDYESWIKVGQALHNTSPELLYLWIWWSKKSSKFEAGKCEAKWDSFAGHTGAKVSLGSLRYWHSEDNQATTPAGPLFRLYKMSELLAADLSIEFWIGDVLVKNQPAIIGGPYKSLKTSIALDAGISIATGTAFLGTYPAEQGNVLFMSGESGLAVLQESVRRITAARGITTPHDSFILSPDLPRFGNEKYIAALKLVLEQQSIDVLFIDPAYLSMPGGDAGNLMVQGDLLRSISEVCERINVTLVLLHHTKKSQAKGEKYQPLQLSDLAWAGFSEWARQWLLLNRRERYTPGTGDHAMWLTTGGSAGHGGEIALDIFEGMAPSRVWDVSVSNPAEARNDKNENALSVYVDACIHVLENTPDGLCKTPLMTAAKVPRGKVESVLAKLASTGRIEHVEKTLDNANKGQVYRFKQAAVAA